MRMTFCFVWMLLLWCAHESVHAFIPYCYVDMVDAIHCTVFQFHIHVYVDNDDSVGEKELLFWKMPHHIICVMYL